MIASQQAESNSVATLYDEKKIDIIYIGCMTGTSADKLADFSAARFDHNGNMIAHQNIAIAIPSKVHKVLVAITTKPIATITALQRAEAEVQLTLFLSKAFSDVIRQLGLQDYPSDKIVLSPHGQTINHQPFAAYPVCDILLNAELLCMETGYRVVGRHRQAALAVSAAAPLAPVLLQHLLYHPQKNTVVINGGGIANITLIPADQNQPIEGYDTGPANAPIDRLVQYFLTDDQSLVPDDLLQNILHYQCDYKGLWAMRGRCVSSAYEQLFDHEYFSRPNRKKSADKSQFDLDWILSCFNIKTTTPADMIATVSMVVADSISRSVLSHHCQFLAGDIDCQVILYGGICHNAFVYNRIKQTISAENAGAVMLMQDFGYDADFIESLLMAYLGFCAVNHIAIDLSYCARIACKDKKPYAIPGTVVYPV